MADLAERIRERLAAVRKSAAAASIEAGLGRSAVQDILSGNSASPRLDTLEKLTGPLQCSIAYLAGGVDVEARKPSYYEDLSLTAIKEVVESGVFKRFYQIGTPIEAPKSREYPHVRDPRLPKNNIRLYRLNDRSLDRRGIFPGDIIHCADFDEHISLKEGQIVLARHSLHPLDLSEFIVRVVHEDGEGFRLSPDSSSSFDEFTISGASMGMENSYFLDDGSIMIEGLVVGIFRDVPIGDDG